MLIAILVNRITELESRMKSKRELARKDWPEEKILAKGAGSFSDDELLAAFIGSGVKGASAKQIARNLLSRYGSRLLTLQADELMQVKGIGKTKAAKLSAVFELACRLTVGETSRSVAKALSLVTESGTQLSLADMLRARSGRTSEHTGRTFMEFFAGIGLVRYALARHGWSVAYANDIDEKKCRMYADHFGRNGHLDCSDIHRVDACDLPNATLATASFPCTDLSLAGARTGIHHGRQSSAFWGFTEALQRMGIRRPPIVMLENVTGFVSSNRGRDFRDALESLNSLGYTVDAFIIDAAHFVPQSRKRLFVVGRQPGWNDASSNEEALAFSHPDLRPPALIGFVRDHPEIAWDLRSLPSLPQRNADLDSLLEDIPLNSALWWTNVRAEYLLSQMSEKHRECADRMIAKRKWSHGTVFRRVRHGKCMAELRVDGTAGCLRTPKGGSAKQILFKAGYGKYHVRLLTPRECARLMGADDLTMRVPRDQALFGLGDAVCVPVVEWIAMNYLNPVVDAHNRLKYEAIA